ncbi:MAG TPA: glycosyltransferase family 39 protein [Polyangiaceae bacterium]|nr:glycosyltransferase family 39 protein [Polyangiaceae bacterium]
MAELGVVAELGHASRARLTPRLKLALGLSLGLLALRLHTAKGLGFGDAEALYACYALYPQPAYLDHPGLIGVLLRSLGRGGAPHAEIAHGVSALVATLVPWLGALAVRATGESWERAAGAVIALALVPELSVGLFGVSPDLPLAVGWLSALALANYLLRPDLPPNHGKRILLGWLALGFVVGLTILAKLSGALLAVALFVATIQSRTRGVWRTFGPWGAVGCAAIVVAPLVGWELANGFPMLEHRLVTTQSGAGFSLKNLGKLVGGQLVYVSPPYLLAAWTVGHHLTRHRRRDPASTVLWWSLVVPLAVLVPLCLWSNRAEPHWIAPPLLALGVHAARKDLVSRRLVAIALGTGAVFTLFVWLSVKTDAVIRLATSKVGQAFGGYQPRYDLSNDLYAWGPGKRLLNQAVDDVVAKTGQLPAVVGSPHWMICAQAQVALGTRVGVGCNSPLATDFERWTPSERWREAPTILLVHDSRYPIDLAADYPSRSMTRSWRTQIRRADRVIRTLAITQLDRSEGVARAGSTRQPTRR